MASEKIQKLEEEKLMLLDMVGNRFASVPCVPEMEYQRVCEENEKLKEDYEGLALTQKLTLKVSDDKQKEIEELQKELFLTKMQLCHAHDNANVKSHNERAGIILEENDRLREKNEELQEEFDGWKASYDDDIRELEGNLADAQRAVENANLSCCLMLGKIKKLKKVVKKLETTSD